MLLALDTQYDDDADRAWTGSVRFQSWTDQHAVREARCEHRGLAPYRPGHFYLRELPCLRPVVEAELARAPITAVIVDGYVDLADERPGLGRHLYRAFDGAFEVVGVAKSPFRGARAQALLRGRSQRPLFVSSTLSNDAATERVRTMAGAFRIPDLLRRVDHLARGRVEPS